MIHLAGTCVRVGPYVIQRCLLCGAELDFVNPSMVRREGGYAPLTVGGLYEVNDGCPRSIVLVSVTQEPVIEDPAVIRNLCVRERLDDG